MLSSFQYRILTWIVIIFTVFCSSCCSFFDWTPHSGPRKDLLCPQTCQNEEIERCCSCNAISKFKPNQISDETKLEYIDIRGKGIIIDTFCEQPIGRYQHFCSLGIATNNQSNHLGSSVINSLTHKYGYLRYMPVNSCFVRPIINMNLAHNLITDIGNLSCYTKLETLNLKGNKISYVTNDTFIGLSNLRKLDLSDNVIKYIDPNTFADKTVEIFLINVAHNNMKKLDISNFLLQKTFCYLDFTDSLVGKVTNLLHMKIEKNKKYGSGNVTFANTSMSEHPFKSLFEEDCSLLTSVDIISKQFFGIWEFDGSSVKCECTIGRLLKIGINFLERFYHKSHLVDLTCNYPEKLKGKNLIDIAKDNVLLNEMTCSEKPCHPSCTCLANPHTNRLIVNCTNAKLTSIPEFVPKSCFNIELLLNNNSIKTLEHRDFFRNVSFLDISNNILTNIEPSALAELTSVIGIKLQNNTLSTLPHEIQLFHPDMIDIGDTPIPCDCDNLWIGEWRQRRESKTNNTLFCKLKGKKDLVLAENVFANELGCVSDKPFQYLPLGFGIVLCVLSPLFLILFFCRGEIFILTRKIRTRKLTPNFQFDLYLSFDENDDSILSFVMSDLYPIMMKNGYKIFIPCKDLSLGSPREQETIDMMEKSKTVLIILSKNYGNDEDGWTRRECKKAFQLYLQNLAYNVVVIKFECGIYLKAMNTTLSAFLRLGKHIDITNRHKNLYTEVVKKVGLPFSDQIEEFDDIEERVMAHEEITDVNNDKFQFGNAKNDIGPEENIGVHTDDNNEFENEERDIVRAAKSDLTDGEQEHNKVFWSYPRTSEIHPRPKSNTSLVSILYSDACDAQIVHELSLVDC